MKRSPSIAKVTRPEPVQVLLRTRLFHRLDAAAEQPVIWIRAPAGAGKTMLVSSYLKARKLHGLWYQVDEGDSDLASFFHYLGLAARAAAPRYRTPLPALTPEYLPGLKTFTRRYFERLYQRLKPPALWVLDNYQELPLDTPLHEVMREAATTLPRGVRLVLISRTEPPPAFARLRTHGELTFLDWEALRLTLEEAQGVAALRQGKAAYQLSAVGIEQLHAQTQGWAAGLVLLLDQVRSERAEIAPVEETTQRVLFDYFAGELFNRAAASTQAVLLKTALLPRMTARMAEELTGDPDTGRALTELHRNNFFMYRRAEAEAVYEYHPLFRDFLHARAEKTFVREQLSQLRRQAAAILARAGQTEEAIVLYRAASDWAALIPLILSEAPQLLTQGRHQTLAEWLTALPPEPLEQNPWLRYWQGMARLPFDPVEARQWLERAFAGFERQDDATGLYLAWAGVVDTITLEYRDFTLLDPWMAALERVRARHGEFPSLEVELRVHSVLIALTHRPPQRLKPARWAERALGLLEACGDVGQGVMLGAHLLHYYAYNGDRHKAERVIEMVRRLERTPGIPPLAQVFWYAAQALYGWFKGAPDAGLAHVTAGLALARRSGMHILDGILNGLGACGGLVAGDLPRAEGFLCEMATAPHGGSPIHLSFYHYLSAMLWQQRGDFAQGLEHARRALALNIEAGALGPEAFVHIAIAPLLCERGEDREAAEHLRRARAIGEMTGSGYVEYACLMTEAIVALRRGQEAQCLDRLAGALQLSREMGGLTAAIWGPAVMARLCAKGLEAGIETEYVQALIRRSGLSPSDPASAPAPWPWPVKVYTLGRFSVLKDGEPLRFSGKAQKKPLELLMVLLALGGREVPQVELADALWPDSEGDAAYRALITNEQRLRRLLGHPQAFVVTNGKVSLDPRSVWVDAWAFERLLGEAEGVRKQGPEARASSLCEQALGLYHGSFLSKTDWPWAVARRERLRAKYLQHLLAQGKAREGEGRWEEAAACYHKGIEADELVEAFYQQLIRCYQSEGRATDARAVYERCRKVLAAALGTAPSATTQRLFS